MNFEGNILRRPNSGQPNLRTKEGPAAVIEAINFLKAQLPVPNLQWDSNLAKSALDHVTDMDANKVKGHTGSDGS